MKDYSYFLEGTNGKGVLLVHGLTGAPAEMKFVAKRLHAAGYSVYAPTLAGHGQDERALLATRFEDWAESLRLALNRFGPEITEVHAAGICVGGGLALYLAHLEPERVRRVVVYSATLDYDGWASPFYYKLGPVGIPIVSKIPVLRGLSLGESEPYGVKSERLRKIMMSGNEMEGTLPRFPLRALNENYRLNRRLKQILPAMRTPTLLIHAREDDVSHPRNAYRIQAMHGGECRVVMLEESYHMLHVDQERRAVADLTARFFEGQADA